MPERVAGNASGQASSYGGILLDPSDHNVARQSPADFLKGLELTIVEGLKQAKQADAKVVNGAEMFIGQAAEQFKLFTHKDCPMDIIRKTVLNELTKKS